LYDHKDFIKAKNCGLKAYNIAKSFNSPADQLAMLKNLVIIDSIHASSYASQYIRISDSLQLAERRNRNKFARIAFETDEIIQEKDNAIRQKKIAIATGSGLLLCSVLFLIIRIQRSRQKELIHIQQQQRSDQAIYDLVHNQQSQIDEARQHEKTRIARELHDGVMNRLSSTRLNLYVLNSQRDDATIDKCVRLIDDLQNVEKELRQVAHELSDDIFSGNKSFNVLLQALIDENRPLTEAQIHVEIDERINWELCEGAIKINAYRILQEALQNIRKYSNARNIFVTLSKIDNELKLVIYDDGIGFNPDKKRKGIGIKNIFTRVNSLNGTIKLLTQPGQGVAYNISLPLSKN
jgi:signal transduction histidine kinase